MTAASTCGPSSSPVSTSTPDGTSTATTGTPVDAGRARPRHRPAARAGHRSRRSRRPPRRVVRLRATYPPVKRTTRPPAAAQGLHARLVDVVGQQPRLDRAPAPGEQRPGVQRVPAVVAGADQQQHPPPVRRPQQVDARRTPARPRPAASASPRAASPSAPPRRPAPARPCARAASVLQHHHGRRDAGVVGERQVDRCDAQVVGAGRGRCRAQLEHRPAGGLRDAPRRRARPVRRAPGAPWPAPPSRRTGRPATRAEGPPRSG